MKNIEEIPSPTIPSFRVRIQGAPPLRGWAVKHLSGMEDLGVKPGFWLSQWRVSSTGDKDSATFKFEPELAMCFNEESVAKAVSTVLREQGEIQTEIVRIGEFAS
jgi:hypothetical protein